MRRRRRYLFISSVLGLAAAWAWAATGTAGAAPWTVAGAGGIVMLVGSAAAARAAIRSAADARMISVINDVLDPPPRFVALEDLPRREGALFHGWGIRISWAVRQKIAEMAAGHEAMKPQHWAAITRTLLERGRPEPIFTPIETLFQMVQIVGMIGSGKSRQLELLGCQAALVPNLGVNSIDPKGDKRLMDWLFTMAVRTGKPWYPFSPEYPALSMPYNPLEMARSALAVADMMKSALPSNNGRGEAFAATQHGVMLDTSHALLELGIPPSFYRLRYHTEEGGREALFLNLLWKTYPRGSWGNSARQAIEKYNQKVREYEREGECDDWFVPSDTLSRLAHTLSERDTIGKMSISMMPLLKTLSDGPFRELMSPEGPGLRFSWEQAARTHGMFACYLSQLAGSNTATVLSKLFLLDLKRSLGDLLSYFPHEIDNRRMVLLIDESARAAPQDDFCDLVGMARAPKTAILAATQTMHDYVARLGDAAMKQLLTNMGTFIQFRGSALDAELFAEGLGTAHITASDEQYSYRPALFSSGDRESSDFDARLQFRTENEEVDLVPPAMITGLPRFHFLIKYGADVYLGVEPLLPDPERSFLDEADRKIVLRPPGSPGVRGRPLVAAPHGTGGAA